MRVVTSLIVAVTVLSAVAQAQTVEPLTTAAQDELTTLYVWGRREAGIGLSSSASEGVVSYGSYADRPLLRTGEIAEVIPGLAVTQHSGTGKANQYFLRGFNLDHGTDFSMSINGAPLNLRTNAHGQGYLDLNVLIPELAESIHYRKGPYHPDSGDFSVAGSASINLFTHSPEDFVTLGFGEHGYGRLVGMSSLGSNSYVAVDFTRSDGPWERDENLQKANVVLHQNIGSWALTAMGYSARWDSTDQIPQRAVLDGSVSSLGVIDPTDGGKTSRFILTAQLLDSPDLAASAYLQKYRLNLWSNFTYFLDNPIDGDQFEQAEDRWITGGSIASTWARSGDWSIASGGELRYDHIGNIGLYRTKARRLLSTDREDTVEQGSAGVWTDAKWQRDAWRGSFGVRYDVMGVNVSSDDAFDSGNEWDGILSPTATLARRLSQRFELYADVGRGYHSNDARGATVGVDPVDLFVPALGGELGLRFERPGLSASLAVWGLKLDSELVYTGDAGDTSSSNASRRVGAEVLLNWVPMRGINIDFSAASTNARYRDTAPGENYIPNALRYVVTGGVSFALSPRNSAEFTVRRLGPASLVEDNSVVSGASTLTNFLYRYDFGKLSAFAEVLNVFDRQDDDITYFYASRLRGEPAEGVEDIHFHPMEPRTFRIGMRWTL